MNILINIAVCVVSVIGLFFSFKGVLTSESRTFYFILILCCLALLFSFGSALFA